MTPAKFENLVCRCRIIRVILRPTGTSDTVYIFPSLTGVLHSNVEHHEPQPHRHFREPHSLMNIGFGFAGHQYSTGSRDWLSSTESSMANPQEAPAEALTPRRTNHNGRYARELARRIGQPRRNVGEAPAGYLEQPDRVEVQGHMSNGSNMLHRHHDDNRLTSGRCSFTGTGLLRNRADPHKLLGIFTIRYAISGVVLRFGMQEKHVWELLYLCTQCPASRGRFSSNCLSLLTQPTTVQWGRKWMLVCRSREIGCLGHLLTDGAPVTAGEQTQNEAPAAD